MDLYFPGKESTPTSQFADRIRKRMVAIKPFCRRSKPAGMTGAGSNDRQTRNSRQESEETMESDEEMR